MDRENHQSSLPEWYSHAMPASPAKPNRKRISVAVEGTHLGHIRNCLMHLPHENFTVDPIISGYGVGGYWSSEYGFNRVGERVMIRFTTDFEPIRPMLASGFGILASKVLQIQVTDEIAA